MSCSCNRKNNAQKRADISDIDDEITETAWQLMSWQERIQGKLLLQYVIKARVSALTSATATTRSRQGLAADVVAGAEAR